MTSQTLTSAPRVDYSKLYGVTHTPEGAPVVRVPKLIKVSIGAPKGKAIVVYTQRTDDPAKPAWLISVGAGQNAKSHRFATRPEAERAYPDLLKAAPDVVYPRKLGFFAFTRPTADGTYEPAWDAIEQHGPMPTEIDLLFFDHDPFETSFAMWGATELRCKGNGLQAERLVRFIGEDKTATDAERFVAKQQADGRVAIDGCWSQGCRFSRPTKVNGKEQPSPCKPSGDLKFQLANSIVIGGTAFFHTTGFRSITQIFSSLAAFKQLTGGRLAGIPMRFVIRPYMTKHNGQAAKQFGVSLEFRAETLAGLKQKLLEQASAFRDFLPAAPLQLTGGGGGGFDGQQTAAFNEEDVEDLTGMTEEAEAAMINAEFTDGGEAPVVGEASGGAAAATQAKTAALRERIAAPTAAPVAAPVAAAPTAAPVAAAGAFF